MKQLKSESHGVTLSIPAPVIDPKFAGAEYLVLEIA